METGAIEYIYKRIANEEDKSCIIINIKKRKQNNELEGSSIV